MHMFSCMGEFSSYIESYLTMYCFLFFFHPTDNIDKEPFGIVTLKHIYEIAKIKQKDPALQDFSLQEVCKQVIASSRTIGIRVVKEVSVEDLRTFREDASQRMKAFEEAMEQAKQEAHAAAKAGV